MEVKRPFQGHIQLYRRRTTPVISNKTTMRVNRCRCESFEPNVLVFFLFEKKKHFPHSAIVSFPTFPIARRYPGRSRNARTYRDKCGTSLSLTPARFNNISTAKLA